MILFQNENSFNDFQGFHWNDSSNKSDELSVHGHDGIFTIAIVVSNVNTLPPIEVKLKAKVGQAFYEQPLTFKKASDGSTVSSIDSQDTYFYVSDPDLDLVAAITTGRYELTLDCAGSPVDAWFLVYFNSRRIR